jgi:hypothetical protein
MKLATNESMIRMPKEAEENVQASGGSGGADYSSPFFSLN